MCNWLRFTNLRPHIKLYHTIVPCRWCWDGETDGEGGSGVLIWIDVCMLSFCWLRFRPIDDPPIAGLIPLLMHGTPMVGVGSSGGVTWNFSFVKLSKKISRNSPPIRCFRWARTWWGWSGCWPASGSWSDWCRSPRARIFAVRCSFQCWANPVAKNSSVSVKYRYRSIGAKSKTQKIDRRESHDGTHPQRVAAPSRLPRLRWTVWKWKWIWFCCH